MLMLSARSLEAIRRHAEREYPRECCGLLVGRIVDEGRTREVSEICEVSNAFEEGERHRRMAIPPLEYAKAERRFSSQGLGVVGNYHSHPEHPAEPSQFDLENLAPWPTMSYVIVSVRGGEAKEFRSWELAADRSRFAEESVATLGTEGLFPREE